MRRCRWRGLGIVLLVCASLIIPAHLAAAQTLAWVRQFGSAASDGASGVSVDASGNAYVAGRTAGTLPGQTSAGGEDAFLRKYDPGGNALWTRQFGTAASDAALDVAVDASGNAYVVGHTGGTLPGQTSGGGGDAFVRKYDPSGNALWTRQFGAATLEIANGVAVDGGGNAFVVGFVSSNAFVRKYDPGGNTLWTHQFGSAAFDQALDVAVDASGNAYVAGETDGTLPGQTSAGAFDAFVRKYDSGGNEIWTRQFGTTAFEEAFGVAVDSSGNAYVAGWTGGSFPGHTSAGSADPFVRKYDPSGNELWTRQFGTAAFDAAAGVALDAGGNAYLTGSTDGTFPGQASAGGADAFVRKYDTGGNPLWTRQFGTAASDQASDAAVDAAGNAYVAGSTGGTFPGQTSAGGVDAFAAKIVPGQMFTVNTTDDLDDGLCDALHCSLREAINAANTNPGKDTIAFNIPGPAFHTIKPGSELPTISDPVTIDGTTEPDYSGRPVVELDGSNAGSGPNFSNGLTISAGNTTIRALTINRFFGAGIFLLGGSGNMIEGNYIGTDVTGTVDRGNAVEGVLVFGSSGNRIGGTAGSISHPFGMCTGSCNLISGNDKDGIGIVGASVGNQIQGNMIGTWVVGEGDLGNSQDGVFIGGSGSAATGNIIGGTTLAALNVISANDRNGVRINGAGSTGNVVQGNFIGTRGSGSGDLGNAQSGVVIDGGSAGNTIGGTASGAGNLISGNDLDGVSLSAAGSGNSILGNKIGTDRGFGGAAFADIGNSFHGIRVVATSGVMIGGTPANAPNTIAFNDDDGIAVVSGTGNSIRRNAIFSNGGLGIDLGTNGVTANDPGDGDTGANDLQNFTVLTSAITAAGVTTVQGTLDSTPNTTFTLEFFANGVCDASGHGEGESFKGSTMVTTNGSGMASFAFVLSTAAPAGQFLTATATDPGNNTSELSKCREVSTAAGAVTDLIGDVQDLKLQQGIENSLIVKLQAALGALAAGDTTTACNNLGAFINEVQAQSGKKIPAQDAADLVKKAEDLKKALGCP